MAFCAQTRDDSQTVNCHTDGNFYDSDDDNDMDARDAADDQAAYADDVDGAGDDYDDVDASLADTQQSGAASDGKVVLAERDLAPIANNASKEARIMKRALTSHAGRPAAMKEFTIVVKGGLSQFASGCSEQIGSDSLEYFQLKNRATKGGPRVGNPKAVHVVRIDITQINSGLESLGTFDLHPQFSAKHALFSGGKKSVCSGLIPNSPSTQYDSNTVFVKSALLLQHHKNNSLPSMEVLRKGLQYQVLTLPAQKNATTTTEDVKMCNMPLDHPIIPYLKKHVIARNSPNALSKQTFTQIKGNNLACWAAPAHFVDETLAFLSSVHQTLKPFDLTTFSVTARLANAAELAGVVDQDKNRPVHVAFTFRVHYVFAE